MSAQLTSFANVGLRHVLEDALAVLAGKSLPQTRREYVLEDVLKLCRDAQRGSQIASQRTLFVSSRDEPALERFSLFERYLNYSSREEWVNRLDKVCQALEAVLHQQEVSPDVLAAAVAFLGDLHRNLRRRWSMESLTKTDGFASRY